MADRIESLKALAQEYNVRSAFKLRQQAQLEGVSVSLKEAQQALASNTSRQVFAPARRPQGRSSAPGPDKRLQYDLVDFSLNTRAKKGGPKYILMGIDVFSREVAAQAIPSKDPATVNKALKKTQEALVGDEKNFSLTTDLGAEFNRIEDVIPEQSTWRQKTPEDKNATSVLDRNMKTIKQDLSAKVATKGGDWSEKLPSVINAYNNRPHEAVFGPPSQVETRNGGENEQQFRILQQNADFYVKNRQTTQRRLAEVRDLGAYRNPTNAPRSFQPQFGPVQKLQSADSQYVTASNGKKTLLKLIQPVAPDSANIRQTLTLPGDQMTRLKGAADQVQAYLSTQGGEMPVLRLDALVKADGAGLSGVNASLRRSRSTLRKMLAKFKTHFIVRNGVVRTTAPAAPPPETAEQRRERMDRQFEAAQRLREEQDRQRDQRQQDRRQRLRDMRGVYDVRGRPA